MWTSRDRQIVVAFELYEATLCSGCGQDKSRSMNPDMGGWYQVQTFECAACKALQEHRDKDDKVDLSLKEFVLDTRPADDLPLPWVLQLIASDEVDQQTTEVAGA